MATQKFLEVWSKKFLSVVIYTLHVGDYYKGTNIIVKEYNNMPELCFHMWRAEKSQKETVYYSDDHFGFLLGMINKTYIHTYHGNWPDAAKVGLSNRLKSFYFIPLYYWTLKNAAYIINVSQYMKRFTDKVNPNSAVIRNGMDFKEQKSVEKYPKTCLMVGNVDKRKYKYCIELAEYMRMKGTTVNIHIYGKIIDSQIETKLRKYKNISLMGMVRSVPYQAYDVFLNLSEIENLSISVCEAIYNRVPVVCFDVGGLPEVVKNGVTGYTVEHKSIPDVYNKILDIEENGMKVDDSVLKDFDWKSSAQKYMYVFQEIYQ